MEFQPKLGALKTMDMKLQDMKMSDRIAGHENARYELMQFYDSTSNKYKKQQFIHNVNGDELETTTRSPAKARFGRPYGKNGRLGGHIGETGSRNMAATQKINSLTLVSLLLLQTLFG